MNPLNIRGLVPIKEKWKFFHFSPVFMKNFTNWKDVFFTYLKIGIFITPYIINNIGGMKENDGTRLLDIFRNNTSILHSF